MVVKKEGLQIECNYREACNHQYEIQTCSLLNEMKVNFLQVLKKYISPIKSVAFNKLQVAFGASDGSIQLLDVATLKWKILKGHTDSVNSIAFSLNGKYLASGCCDRTVKLWSVEFQKELATLTGHNACVTSI